MSQETTDCQVSDERGTAHQTVTQADYTKGSKWWLFFHAIQLHGILHLQLLPASATACNRLSLTYLLPVHLHRNWGQPAGELARWQDVSCSSVDIIHSCDGNLDPFYKELGWEGNCFSFHARWKSRLPLKPAESMQNKKKERYTAQTCTRDFLALGQAEGASGRTRSSCPICT